MKKMMKRLFCTVRVLLLCMTSVPLTNVEAAEENMIPDDAVEFNGHYYKVYQIGKYFEEAKEYCKSLGGHLVTITSEDENAFVLSMIQGLSEDAKGYLIGFEEIKEGEWI